MKLNTQAVQLNKTIAAYSPSVMDLLSEKGKGIYFPEHGILSQSAEAKGKEINASIGIAMEDDGTPMCLLSISQHVGIPAGDVFSYAPSAGLPELRKEWKAMMIAKSPELSSKSFSLPTVTSGITHGLSICGYLFCDRDDRVIIPDLFWENYELTFSRAYGTALDRFPMFTAGGGFNVRALREKLLKGESAKRIVCLNFPNNPTGYTPTVAEIKEIAAALLDVANRGFKVLVIIDDAYFGLVFEHGIYTQSLFSELCDIHPNLLAVKLDGATKEDYVWGFRVGFITYGIRNTSPALLYEALEAKTAGAIRGNISNSSKLAQSLLLRAYSSGSYEEEKQQKYELLHHRYETVKEIFRTHPEYAEQFTPLPFNSGYFMCINLLKADSEKVRRKLLTDYSTGVIARSNIIRIAFSSTPSDKIEKLLDNIYQAAKELKTPP